VSRAAACYGAAALRYDDSRRLVLFAKIQPQVHAGRGRYLSFQRRSRRRSPVTYPTGSHGRKRSHSGRLSTAVSRLAIALRTCATAAWARRSGSHYPPHPVVWKCGSACSISVISRHRSCGDLAWSRGALLNRAALARSDKAAGRTYWNSLSPIPPTMSRHMR
jgi:hypothetical protein